jgi:hypothetical protein
MDFKIPAVVKNVKIPGKIELKEESDCRKGDVVLVKVISQPEDAFLKYVRSPENEKIFLKKGDIFLSALSDRYAARVLNGMVPKYLKKGDVIDLIQQGGESGIIKSARSEFVKTKLEFLGFAMQNGKKMNIMDFALSIKDVKNKINLVIVVGVNMESGKTVTTAELCGALTRKGYKVCCGKLTGIGSVYDTGKYLEKDAVKVYGILDAGYPSSANLSMREIEDVFMRIFSNLAAEGPGFVLLEIADSILQRETAMLLGSRVVRKYKPRFILNCNDALGAYGGKLYLREKFGIEPLVVCGLGTITELGRKEIESITKINAFDPVAQPEELAEYILSEF